jgi:hypothetical protein
VYNGIGDATVCQLLIQRSKGAVLTITRDQDGNDETVLRCQSLLLESRKITHNGNNTSHDDGDNTLHHEIGT